MIDASIINAINLRAKRHLTSLFGNKNYDEQNLQLNFEVHCINSINVIGNKMKFIYRRLNQNYKL